MRMFSGLRQLWYPSEFRIAALSWPTELHQLLSRLARSFENSPPAPQAGGGDADARLLSDISTGLWRLRQKMVKPGSFQPLDEMRRPYRHLESIWDALAQAGVEIQDHTDKPFDSGMSIKATAYQPTPGLQREQIIETIKPSVYLKGKRIQIGEVIVGQPEKNELPGASS
jgi:hypothetical protein